MSLDRKEVTRMGREDSLEGMMAGSTLDLLTLWYHGVGSLVEIQMDL